jgi:DnaJ-class molecular chaperone
MDIREANTEAFFLTMRDVDKPVKVKRVPCVACNGDGKAPCDWCDGEGVRECKCCECGDEHERKCSWCKGTGADREKPCSACKGSKGVDVLEERDAALHPADAWTIPALWKALS